MRSLVVAALLVSAPALAAEPSDLAGTWHVSSTELPGGTCPTATPGKVWAHVWTVSTTPQGEVSISVQGETAFPSLLGGLDKGRLVVEGINQPVMEHRKLRADIVWVSLEQKGAELVGVRRFLAMMPINVGKFTDVLVPCFTDMEVRAKR